MVTRQSLRLLGIGPEVQLFQDKCFICRLDLDIASVTRCHVMPCCGKFLHKRCFRKARETSFQCGHCRIVGEDETSNSTDTIDPIIWYLFWVNMDWFISTIPEGPRPLYIHAVVYTPVEPLQSIRKAVYRLINMIMPAPVRECLSYVKYRIRFRQAGGGAEAYPYPYDPNQVTFTHIRFARFWSPVYYPEDRPYTTELPPTPPESPQSSTER